MSTPRKGPGKALSPEELAGHLDQQILSAVGSAGPVLGRCPRAGSSPPTMDRAMEPTWPAALVTRNFF
jgi:hypothetical protein